MDRFSRQTNLVPDKIQTAKIAVIGAGAVGRNLCLSLASMGAKNVIVVDFDTIEPTNITTQGYNANSVGQSKADVLVESMYLLDYEDDANYRAIVKPWSANIGKEHKPEIVFSCVDRMDARKAIFNFCLKNEVQLFIDGRMQGENLRFITVNVSNMEYYPSTLFTDEEAYQGRCTQRSSIYSASILANSMVHQFTRHLRNIPTERDMMINLLSSEMIPVPR
jgi:molybdopterin-synthase adenylyltransferase